MISVLGCIKMFMNYKLMDIIINYDKYKCIHIIMIYGL